MSRFVHKVKDAMTDHEKETTGARGTRPPQEDTRTAGSNPDQYNSSSMNPSSGMDSKDSYGSDPRSGDEPGTYRDSKFNDTHGAADPASTGMGNRGGRSDPDTHGSTEMGGDGSTRASAGSSDINAGPHDSKMANKMDPRVDSDMDNRAQSSGATNPQMSSNAPGNTAYGQPRTQGVDNHVSSDDDYNKSTQEKSSQSRPSNPEGHWASEASHETSTQEHKSHSATSHAMPCQTNLQDEPGSDNRAAEPKFGGNAAGGSSNTAGVREPTGTQNPDPLNKLDPRVTRSNKNPSHADQRSGY
ncbi:hypothetical protein PENFLA_c085G01520 [Penicillium flavigenum]|uniref:Uncharacterized protein n=1 Tax=Penicillium flavigenum TaxID=254877 RepID=A0A1V6SA37_9EURO|nr:hypothetical protein PENFLA_c085G01520 [Penicillium flavigenum]